jgi:hypothetical protein
MFGTIRAYACRVRRPKQRHAQRPAEESILARCEIADVSLGRYLARRDVAALAASLAREAREATQRDNARSHADAIRADATRADSARVARVARCANLAANALATSEPTGADKLVARGRIHSRNGARPYIAPLRSEQREQSETRKGRRAARSAQRAARFHARKRESASHAHKIDANAQRAQDRRETRVRDTNSTPHAVGCWTWNRKAGKPIPRKDSKISAY